MQGLKADFEAQPVAEEAPELTAFEVLGAGQAPLFCKKTTLLIAEAIRESVTEAELAETLSLVCSRLLHTWGHHTFPNGQLNKEFVRVVARAFKDKVEDLVEQDQSKTGTVLKYVIDVVFDSIHEQIRDFKAVHISSMAVSIAMKLFHDMFGGFAAQLKAADLNLSQNVELSAVILAHFLLDLHPSRCQAYNKECSDLIFNLVYKTFNIQRPNYKLFMRPDLAHARFMFLGKCLENCEPEVKVEVTAELLDQLETLVLNDREQLAKVEVNLMYFQNYLAIATQESIEGRILPKIQFIMNRSKRFVTVNAKLIMFLKSYQIENIETLRKWTTDLLSDELLMSIEQKDELVGFIKSVHGICSEPHDMKQALIMDVLIDKFKQTKKGQSQFQARSRQTLLHQIFALISSDEKENHVNHDLLQVVLEHFFQTKEEAEIVDIAEVVYKFVSLALPQDTMDLLLPLLQKQPRVAFPQQVQILLNLMKTEADIGKLKQIESIVSEQFMTSLMQENFKSIINYSSILALTAFQAIKAKKFNDLSSLSVLLQNDQIASYMFSQSGYINSLEFIESKKSLQDTQNHMLVIESMLQYHFEVTALQQNQLNCLLNTLCECLLNTNSTFRESAVLSCFQNLQHLSSQFTIPLYKTMFEKISEVSSRPAKQLGEFEFAHQQSLKIGKKIQFVMKMLYNVDLESKQPQRSAMLEKQEFFLLLRTICHPYVSAQSKDLMIIVRTLTDIMDNQAQRTQDREYSLPAYFKKYFDEIVQYALVQRTGILSPNDTLRVIAKNMLICLGWQGYLGDFIGKLVTILNYKPIELTVKLRAMIKKEASMIGPYDMMFFSEVTKDLSKLLDEKDQQICQSELQTSKKQVITVESARVEKQEEQKVEVKKAATSEPAKAMTPAQLQAALMQKMAAAGKGKSGGAAAKGGAKGAGGRPAAASKAAAAAQPKPAPVVEEVINKETRKKMDTQQLLNFCDEIQSIKARHVQTVWEILRCVNQIKEVNILNYQDITLKHTVMPAIRLLNYGCTRFSTLHFLENLFMDNRQSPFFGIRIPLMSCLQSVQENRIYQRTVYDFQKFFLHIQQAADFSDIDVGYLQMILMLANFVLQSLEVNLSVKESALSVAQEILDTNLRVKNMDLVRLTINMMKSNYIGKNLSNYLNKLIRRLSQEELAIMLQRLFEYDPTARQKFLNEILVQPDPLFCPVWFSTQMWIMQFDDEFFSLSRKIWNRYGLVLRSGALEIGQEKELCNIYHHLRSSNTAVFDMTVKSAVAAIEILQGKFDSIIDDLLKFYHSEIVIVKQLNLEALKKTGDDNNFEGNRRFNRIALPQIIERTSKFVPHASVQKLLDFFIVIGSADTDPAVSQRSLDAADALVHSRGLDYAGKMLQILERFIENAHEFKEESVNHAIVLIGTLSNYLDKNNQKKLIQTFEKMLQLLSRSKENGASELVNKAICKCIPLISRFFEDRTKQIFNEQLNILRAGKKESEIRGAAFACAGIIKGQGMKFFKERDIIGILQRECFTGKKTDPLRLQAGLQLYETLSFSQGKAFEPYIKELLPNIMNSIADAREPVRACANAANQQIIRNFSNYAIKQVVPMFLEGLKTDNWRGKYAAVEAVGNMAHCAPKQISGFLPDIVKALREVLNDTHEKVHEAAIKAVSKIGSVIKCPEVAELLDVIILALGNSNLHLNACLDALLKTSFVHAIDAPSLSLLVPLVDIGLTMHDNSSKQMASKLMGNICNLTQDPEDLLPYMKILIPAIKNSLFDSIPEVRASASKALGKLSKGLGLANSIELLEWLNMNLHRKDLAPSERSGAAQGLSEVVSTHGDNFFSNQCKEIITLARSKEIGLRESYRTVMAYLPTSFSGFVDYLLVMLPIMIEGLADESEEVRKVSMRNVKICIQQYGKKASELLCKPILAMMFDKDSRVRMSSSILMYQLVKEMENDIIKSQPKYINMQMKYSILSGMFILKFDPIDKVQIQASQIWKSLVDAPVHILRMIIETLIKMVFDLIQSKHEELQDMGLACMRGLVEKFGERIVNESLDIFESYLEQATDQHQTSGINRVILNMAGAASHRLLLQIKTRLTTIAEPFLVHDDNEIREYAVKVFTTLFKRLGDSNYTQSTLDVAFLQKLHILMQDKSKQNDITFLIKSLKFMIDSSPELNLDAKIMNLCCVPTHSLKTPLSISQATVLRVIAPKVAPMVFSKKFYNTLFAALNTELTMDPLDPANLNEDRMQALLMCFAELVARIPQHEYNSINEEIMDFHDKCVKRNTIGLYIDLIQYYCQNTHSNYEKHAAFYMNNVLKHMNSAVKGIVEKVVPCISAILEKLPKENQFALVPLIRDAIEMSAIAPVDEHLGENIYRKKVQSIKMLETKVGVQCLVGVIQNSIMHGSIRVRVDSAYCFKYLIDFSTPVAIKTEVIKICGALIRVVNDKFSPDLKIQIFLSLRLLLVKAPTMVKAMVAQLQTTFLKAFGDVQSNDEVRQVVVENLLLLVKMTPKADPIVKELTSHLDGDKLDGEQKVQVSLALALIIREKGKAIAEAISKQVQAVLTSIVDERKNILNDKILVNCAVALGLLSAYGSDPKQMKDLFVAFDNSKDWRLTLGIKLGVLMNGSAKIPDADGLRAAAAKHIQDVLATKSGIIEIDGRDIKEGRPEEEIFRFDGSLDALGHIMNCFQRRFFKSDALESKFLFKALADSNILSKLTAEEDFSAMSEVYHQIPAFIACLPIPSYSSKETISVEQAAVMTQSFAFLRKFYLDFESKRDARPALLNLLQLTHNAGLDLGVSADSNEITTLTPSFIRGTICDSKSLAGIIPQEFKGVCSDIVFAQN